MARASVPVDLWNPGQVLACLGFLEGAERLIGCAEAAFDWTDPHDIKFVLSASGEANPIELVLDFLSQAEIVAVAPIDYQGSDVLEEDEGEEDAGVFETVETFPSRRGDRMALPIRLRSFGKIVDLTHWADGSRPDSFKLYAGNRSAFSIARSMTLGVRKAVKKTQTAGDVFRKGVSQLWAEQRNELLRDPFNVVTPLGGSFNFDPRGAWTAIDAGYSPNKQKNAVVASPLVEILAAWGLESTRPLETGVRKYTYSVWGLPLVPVLARVALFGGLPDIPQRRFQFELAMSGKDKVVNYAEERNQS